MGSAFSSTSTSKTKMPGYVDTFSRDLFNSADRAFKNGPYYYKGSTVPGFSQSTKDALGGMKDLASANQNGAGMSGALQSIMTNGGFTADQLGAINNTKDLANNAGLAELINGNGLTSDQNKAYQSLQDTVYGNNASFQDLFNQGGLTADQQSVANMYRGDMNQAFDPESIPGYSLVRQRALDTGRQVTDAAAARSGRFGGAANQNILSRNQMDTSAALDNAQYDKWVAQKNNAASSLAALSQQGFGNQNTINSNQQAGLQNITNMGQVGVGNRADAINQKSGLLNSLFNQSQAGLANIGTAYDTALKPAATQLQVGQQYDLKNQARIDDKLRRFDAQNPYNQISQYAALLSGAPKGTATTTSPGIGQVGAGILATLPGFYGMFNNNSAATGGVTA